MADLDLSEFMKDGSGAGPADLDWLDVDEEDYRELDTLPKQNLDVSPDLQALWRHQDEPASMFVPNTGAPRTMGDLAGSPMRVDPETIVRAARLSMMRSTDPRAITSALRQRFDLDALKGARTALAGALAERGLLGGFYIDASDFPKCAQGGPAAKFVQRHAREARFVKAKAACGACRHKQVLADGTERCSVFHKQVVVDVPYTEEIAEAVEQSQAKEASEGSPRDRIKRAFSAPAETESEFSGRRQPRPKKAKLVTRDELREIGKQAERERDSQQAKVVAQAAQPIVATLRREMLKGRGRTEISRALKLAFDQRDLEATKEAWLPIFRQAGLYGAVYIDQPSFNDCRIGADFLAKHSSQVKAVVKGDKCGSCIFNKVGRCLMYGRKLVQAAEEVLTPETVAAVLDEQRIAGNLPTGAEKMVWGATPAAALRKIHATATTPKGAVTGGVRGLVERAFRGGGTRTAGTSDLTKRDIVKATHQYMNEGLYGRDLLRLLKTRFEVRDLTAARPELKLAMTEQGLQGIRFVDPSVYDDYGHGCKTAAAKHRTRAGVRYAKVGSKCHSCVHQTQPGHCSVLNKELVTEPPYVDKLAEQKAILASGPAMEVSPAALVNNGVSMINEFELQQTGAIDLNPEGADPQVSVEFGSQEIELP
jgi:hypothetical protein